MGISSDNENVEIDEGDIKTIREYLETHTERTYTTGAIIASCVAFVAGKLRDGETPLLH